MILIMRVFVVSTVEAETPLVILVADISCHVPSMGTWEECWQARKIRQGRKESSLFIKEIY